MAELKVMLAPNYTPNLTKISYPTLVQPKFDGFHGVWIPDQGMISRKGKSFGNEKLNNHFRNLNNAGAYVFQGELYKRGPTFEELSSTLRNSTGDLFGYKYIVFDCVPLEDWQKQKCNLVYSKRLSLLRSLLNDRVADYKRFLDVPTDEVKSAAEAIQYYKNYLESGFEGMMIKDPNALYEWKKVSPGSGIMYKLKPFKSVDLIITDIYQESVPDCAAGVICDFNGKPAKVSSGWTKEQKQDMLINPQNYVGKCIEIKYKELTSYGALKHPNFERFRFDK